MKHDVWFYLQNQISYKKSCRLFSRLHFSNELSKTYGFFICCLSSSKERVLVYWKILNCVLYFSDPFSLYRGYLSGRCLQPYAIIKGDSLPTMANVASGFKQGCLFSLLLFLLVLDWVLQKVITEQWKSVGPFRILTLPTTHVYYLIKELIYKKRYTHR